MLDEGFERLIEPEKPRSEFGGNRGGEMEAFAAAGVIDAQFPGMQHEPAGLGSLALGLRVDRIADEGGALVLHVHTDLVSATGVKVAKHQRRARGGIAIEHLVVGNGGAPGGRGDHCHFLTIARIAANVCEDRLRSGRGDMLRHAEVDFVVSTSGKLVHKVLVGVVVFRHNQATRGVLIEPVYDAGPLHSTDTGKLALAVVKEGVDQRAIVIADGGVHDHAVFLIDDDDVLIFVKHLQGDVLCDGLGGDGLGNRDADAVAEFHRITWLGGFVIAQDEMLANQLLDPRAREVGQTAGQPGIDAVCARLINREDHDVRFRAPACWRIRRGVFPPAWC